MRRPCLFAPCLLALAFGCGPSAPAEDPPVPRPGDTVRPEVSFAPKAPWKAGAKIAIGVLARVERTGREPRYLMDEDVPIDEAVTTARLTFYAGDRPLAKPLDYVLPHDC